MTMKVLSWNVNGIRSVARKGFVEWLQRESPDIICLQEIKTDAEGVTRNLKNLPGYSSYWNFASKKGYSGTAIFSKERPANVVYRIGMPEFDKEGRALVAEYRDFVLINVYLPHGERGKGKMGYKLDCYRHFLEHIGSMRRKNVVICGDFNVAHKEIDLANPKNNQNNTMFTPEERSLFGKILENGFVDTFRMRHKEGGNYTWWPWRNNLRQRNVGWRIDYILVSRNLESKVKDAFILAQVKGSDHCPVGIDFENP